MVVGKIYGKIIMVDGIDRTVIVSLCEKSAPMRVGPLAEEFVIAAGKLLYSYAEITFSQRNKGEMPQVSVSKWEQG